MIPKAEVPELVVLLEQQHAATGSMLCKRAAETIRALTKAAPPAEGALREAVRTCDILPPRHMPEALPDASGCILPRGHFGDHIDRIGEGYYFWTDGQACDCCDPADPDRCFDFGKVAALQQSRSTPGAVLQGRESVTPAMREAGALALSSCGFVHDPTDAYLAMQALAASPVPVDASGVGDATVVKAAYLEGLATGPDGGQIDDGGEECWLDSDAYRALHAAPAAGEKG